MNSYPFQDYAGDNSFDYPFDIVLAANQKAPNEGIRTDTDSDFLLFSFTMNVFSSILFTLRVQGCERKLFQSAAYFRVELQRARKRAVHVPRQAPDLSARFSDRYRACRTLRVYEHDRVDHAGD